MFDEQNYLDFISGDDFRKLAQYLYYEFFESLKQLDSAVTNEEADFSAWDSSSHFEEQLYTDLKEAFYQKDKFRCEFHFYFGMSLYPHTPANQIATHMPIKDDVLIKIPEYQILSITVDKAMAQTNKAPKADKEFITEWIKRYSRRSDLYAKAFLSAGFFTAKRSREVINGIQNLPI